jgi:hypothetical protein
MFDPINVAVKPTHYANFSRGRYGMSRFDPLPSLLSGGDEALELLEPVDDDTELCWR